MDAWINSAAGGRIIDKVTAFSQDGYMMDVGFGRVRLFIGGDAVVSGELPTSGFTHVAGVYDGTSMSVYLNGVLSAQVPTAVASIPTNGLTMRIGADSLGDSRFNGVIDEPRVFNRGLSAVEIATIMWQGTNCP
jgi:hypothetical protein